MLRFDKATYLSLLFKSILFESSSLYESNVLLFPEFVDIVSILYYAFTEFIILLYRFLVISFAHYKEYIILWILFNTFSEYSLLLFLQEILVTFETF